VSDTESAAVESEDIIVSPEADPSKLDLKVEVTNAGPCRKRIHVIVPEADIARIRENAIAEFTSKANVPGFRVGRVPRALVESKFRRELIDELKQRVLVQSLEQLTAETKLDPINEPDMDVESLDIPESGDFEYNFEVEVRPDVEIPDMTTLTLKRPVREISDEDVEKYLQHMLLEYGEKSAHDGPAAAGDLIVAAVTFQHEGQTVREISELEVRVQPVLRFSDAELAGFDKLIEGASAGETRETELKVSTEANYVPMRGETLTAAFQIQRVEKFNLAELNHDLLGRIGVESEEKLRAEIRSILERQVTYRQRQSAREQLLEKIAASSTWDLPEELVMKQVENALHREILEMQQAGYTPREIRARENELRQRSVSTTRQAMKEHFILDRIATDEGIEVTSQDLEMEILMMSFQSGETPRRLRARLVKTGVIENLEAQIRERKAIDIALERAKYEEVPMTDELVADLSVEAVDDAICNVMFARRPAAAEPAAAN